MAFPRRTLEGLSKTIADLKQMIQNLSIPQGTVWWFHNRTNAPVGWAICDGTNGTPNLIGRYPLGATSGIGSTVEAGLPNITGTFFGENRSWGNWNSTLSGAFYQGSTVGRGMYVEWDSDNVNTMFSASRSNAIYGNSTTVTPPSTKLLPCMKL